MFHYYNTITNTKGDSLVGYFVRVIDPVTSNVVAMAADKNGTPIETVSGVTDMCQTDKSGTADFYVSDGDYNLDIYLPDATTFWKRISGIPMFTGDVTPEALAARDAAQAAAVQTAADRVQTGLDRTSTTASATTATTQAGIATTQASIATTAAAVINLKVQTNTATPTVPPAGSSSGDNYLVPDVALTKLTVYLNTAGTGAAVAGPIEIPLTAYIAALKAGVSRTAISRFGSPGTLITGSTLASGRTAITDDAVTQAGTVNTIRFWAAAGGTIKLKRFTLSGSTYTYVDTPVASLTVVAGLNTFTAPTDFTAFAANVGDHFGPYSASAVITYSSTAGTGSLLTNAAGDVTTTATKSNVASSYLQFNMDISYAALMNVASEIDAEAATRAETDTTLTTALQRTLTTVLGANPPVTGGAAATAGRTWIGDDGAITAGSVTTIKFWAATTGTIKVKRYTLSGSTFTYVGDFATLNVVAGLNTFNAPADFTAFPINVGDHLAYYSSAAVGTYLSTAGNGWLATNVSGDNTSTAARLTVASAYFQFGVTTSYNVLLNVDAELQQRPTPLAPATDNASYFIVNENDASGWQQVYSIRKSDGVMFPLTSGSQHSTGALLPSDATLATFNSKNADGTETAYVAPIEGPPSSAYILHSRKDLQCWGDSLTYGATISNPSVNGWVAKLAAAMGRQAYNGGVSGETSTQIATRMLAASQSLHERTAILWSGTNNSTQISTVLADTASMIAAMVGKSKRFLVLPCFNADTEGVGTTSYNQKMALNAALASAYPNNYYDIRGYLATTQALTDAGLTPDSTDLANIAADIIPHQLRGDTLHPNATAATLIATKLQAQIVARNW